MLRVCGHSNPIRKKYHIATIESFRDQLFYKVVSQSYKRLKQLKNVEI